MTIYLQPLNSEESSSNPTDWIELDLASWSNHSDQDYPIKLTLIRRLTSSRKKPCLQEMMFSNLYQKLPIKKITLEIPLSHDDESFEEIELSEIKVLEYKITPVSSKHKNPAEKIILAAKVKKSSCI